MRNMTTGIITDIARFSLNDGPGIRTTVFLKGCPLNCIWCHNPENISKTPQLAFYKDKCKVCTKCIDTCPNKCNILKNNSIEVDFSKCTASGECVEVCPSGARVITGKTVTSDEIIETVIKDMDFYIESGGGVTISGGEPMMQPSFTIELLKSLKEKNIHTAIETCGYARTSDYKEAMKYCDLFMFDYKVTDPLKHKEYTGKDNTLILKNLNFLTDNNASVILRCPIIPKLNDTDEHFKAISYITMSEKNIKQADILPYHNYGVSKRSTYGMPEGFKCDVPSKATVTLWLDRLKEYGCEKCGLG